MTGLWLVTRREIVTRGRSRGFVIGLLVSVALIAVVAALPRLFGDPSYQVGLVGAGSQPWQSVLAAQAGHDQLDLTVTVLPDEATARAAVVDGELDAVVRDGQVVLTDGALDPRLGQLLDSAHWAVTVEQRLGAVGLDPAEVAEVLAVEPLTQVSVGVDAEAAAVRIGLATVVVVVMLLLIYLPAIYVAMGVVEEKSSRVVELLLASIHPWQLLAGKIIGIGVLTLVELVAIATSGLTVATLTGVSGDLPPGAVGVIAGVFLWFVLGYAFFAAMSAAFGSLVSRQEDVNGVLTPVMVLMMAAYGVGFLTVFNPGAPLARVLSIVPPFSAVVMPVRSAAGSVPTWELLLAIVLMVGAALATVAVGARIYRRAVLRTGARVKLREVLTRGRAS